MEQPLLSLNLIALGVILAFGIAGIFRGWQMFVTHSPDLISDWTGRPLKNHAAYALAYARIYIACGAFLLILAIAMAIGLHAYIGIAVAVMAIWVWHAAIDSVVAKAQRRMDGAQ